MHPLTFLALSSRRAAASPPAHPQVTRTTAPTNYRPSSPWVQVALLSSGMMTWARGQTPRYALITPRAYMPRHSSGGPHHSKSGAALRASWAAQTRQPSWCCVGHCARAIVLQPADSCSLQQEQGTALAEAAGSGARTAVPCPNCIRDCVSDPPLWSHCVEARPYSVLVATSLRVSLH